MSNSVQNLQSEKAEQLQDAFDLFNQFSQELTSSYQELEARVTTLTRELAAARDERFQTLIEKEQIANRLQQLLEALPGGVVVLDREQKISDHNSGAVDFLGSHLVGQRWSDVTGRSMFPESENPHERKLKDGRVLSLSSREIGSGDRAETIILLTDRSEMNALQELVNHQKKLSAMGEMVASMAHQVRTPLSTAILYASQLAGSNLERHQQSQFAEKILTRLRHMERQVNDMLVFARNGDFLKQAVDVDHFLEKVRESNESAFNGEQLFFSVENKSNVNQFLGNEDALLGVISNLINNARAALNGSGSVSVEVSNPDGKKLRLAVIDDGPGIPSEQIERIFEPFFTTRSSGTGLGLAVAESVVKAHNGRIWCLSAGGSGSTFVIELPIEEQNVLLSGIQSSASDVREVTGKF